MVGQTNDRFGGQQGDATGETSLRQGSSQENFDARVSLQFPTLVRLFIAAVIIGLLVYFLPTVTRVALLFLAACAIASALNPLVAKLPWRRGISGSLVALSTAALIVGAFSLAGYLLTNQLQDSMQPMSEIRDDLNTKLASFSRSLDLESPLAVNTIVQQGAGWLTGDSETPVFAQVAGRLVDIVVGVVLVAFGVIFLLAGDPYVLLRGMQKLFSPENAERLEATAVEVSKSLRWWLIGHLISATVIATLASLGFWLIDLPFAIPLGIAAGIASFIPVLGPTLVGIIAIVVGASESSATAIWAAVVFACVETIESYVLIPIVMKQAISIPPLVTLFTVVLWASIFGVLGLLLALPVNLVIWAALKNFVIESKRSANEVASQDEALADVERKDSSERESDANVHAAQGHV